MPKATRLLEVFTNISILVVCILLGWILIHRMWQPSGAAQSAEDEKALIGTTLPALAGHQWAAHPETLVLAIRKNCPFCAASLPFYKQLSNLEKNNSLHAHLLAVMPDDAASATEELRTNGVNIDGVFHQSLVSLRVSGTPTLMLLDTNGRITKAWVGELTPQQEKDVIAAVER